LTFVRLVDKVSEIPKGDLMKPWDIFPDLKEEHLVAVAQVLASARQTLAPMFNAATDDNWSHGCRALTACRKAILRAAQSGDMPFLSIDESGRRFIFSIDKVPFRFFRDEEVGDEPVAKTTSSVEIEGAQLALLFPGEHPGLHLRWRFGIEASAIGPADRIFVLGMTEAGVIECKWEVPLVDAELGSLATSDVDDEGDDVAPPEVGFKDRPAAQER
jgi:hypothetical protein